MLEKDNMGWSKWGLKKKFQKFRQTILIAV
jgi:hypothetical protein